MERLWRDCCVRLLCEIGRDCNEIVSGGEVVMTLWRDSEIRGVG